MSKVSKIILEEAEKVASALCAHLPLVKDCRLSDSYMQLIQKLLDHALKESVLLEESRQVIAYAMLHPMYENNPNDRATLNQYSQQVIILISIYKFFTCNDFNPQAVGNYTLLIVPFLA